MKQFYIKFVNTKIYLILNSTIISNRFLRIYMNSDLKSLMDKIIKDYISE